MKAVALLAVVVAVAIAAPYLAPAFVHAFAAIGIAISTVTATTIAAATLMTVASIAIMVLSPKPGTGGAQPTDVRQSISDSQIVIGKCRMGAKLTFFHPDGKKFRYFVWTVAGHRVHGLTKWYLNDQTVTVNPTTGLVTSGDYAGNAWLWFERGDHDAEANATFVAECGGKWTTDHRGRGVAKIYAKFQMTNDVVQAGMPNITCEVEGSDEIYDPRTDTTGYTNNAILAFYWWMGLARPEGGFGCYDDEIDWDWVSAQANVCDEDVPLKAGGTEKRYALDGFMTTGADPSSVRDVLVQNMAGRFTYSGGLMLCRPGYWVPVSSTLGEDDLVAGIQYDLLTPGDQRQTEVDATWLDPDDMYQQDDLPARSLASADVAQVSLDLPFVKSRARGERIQKIKLLQGGSEKKITWPMNINGLGIGPMDTVRCDTSRYGLSNYAFTVTNWALSQDFSIAISLQEENEDMYAWDPDTDETDAAIVDDIGRVEPGTGPEDPEPGSWALSSTTNPPTIVVTGAVDQDDVTDVIFEYRVHGLTTWTDAGIGDVNTTKRTIGPIALDTAYDVAVSYRDEDGTSGRLQLGPITVSSAGIAPAPDTMLTATGSAGSAAIAWRNSASGNYGWSTVFRGTTNVFGSASDISGHVVGGLGQVQQITDTIAAGTYYYWVQAFAADGTPAAPTGPQMATVT